MYVTFTFAKEEQDSPHVPIVPIEGDDWEDILRKAEDTRLKFIMQGRMLGERAPIFFRSIEYCDEDTGRIRRSDVTNI